MHGESAARNVMANLRKYRSALTSSVSVSRKLPGETAGVLLLIVGIISALVICSLAYPNKIAYIFNFDPVGGNILFTLFAFSGAVSIILISSFLVFLFQRKYSRAKRLAKGLKELNEKFTLVDERFGSYVQANTECDRMLFDLFIKEMAPKKIPKEQIEKSIMIINHNIEMILDHTVRVFEGITGDKCAVSVKIIDINQDGKREHTLRAHVLYRDTQSRGKRYQLDKRNELIQNNTAEQFVFSHTLGYFPNQIFACDDLRNATDRGEYKNDRPDWFKDYNATIVCAIHNLRPDVSIPFIGILCVDNMQGSLDTSKARQYIRRMSWRLSIMLYRMDVLQGCLSDETESSVSIATSHPLIIRA